MVMGYCATKRRAISSYLSGREPYAPSSASATGRASAFFVPSLSSFLFKVLSSRPLSSFRRRQILISGALSFTYEHQMPFSTISSRAISLINFAISSAGSDFASSHLAHAEA